VIRKDAIVILLLEIVLQGQVLFAKILEHLLWNGYLIFFVYFEICTENFFEIFCP